jgi:uncharacterized protein YjbI with pentapeptide repeats
MKTNNPISLGDTVEKPSNKVPSQKKKIPAWIGISDKTLWDILQFICTAAVPIVLTVWSMQQAQIARNQEAQNDARNEDNQRAKVMSDYLDAMTKYLVMNPAKVPDPNKVNSVARARTLNTLRQLDRDPDRKGQLLKFLYEASLIQPCQFANIGKGNNCQGAKLNLSGARLDEVTFDTPPIMKGIELSSARLSGAKLPGIDLTQAQLDKANISDADLSQATLKEAQMRSVILKGTKLTDAVLNQATLANALLANADLRGARLVEANLSGADVSNANLENANLEKADLRGTILTDASLNNTNLRGAIYNSRTQFPKGFTADGKGMNRQE